MDKNIAAFMLVLDPNDNSTGGGTASSVAGTMAAGLAAMVARLSVGKKGLKPSEHYEEIATDLEALGRQLFDGGRRDSEAFAVVSAAFKMPKESDEEKAARSLEIKEGMLLCAEVPLANAKRCGQVIALCDALLESYNTNAASDLECAGHLARAGLRGCAANVHINLPYIKDETVRQGLTEKLQAAMSAAGLK
jgi:formiminotetrahydrofolate cyclodeaminase